MITKDVMLAFLLFEIAKCENEIKFREQSIRLDETSTPEVEAGGARLAALTCQSRRKYKPRNASEVEKDLHINRTILLKFEKELAIFKAIYRAIENSVGTEL
jgi:hypothetical protein